MKFFLCISLLLISFFSCSEKQQQKNILPENKMRDVMWDMMRADQYVSSFLPKDSAHDKTDQSIALYEEIFQIHKITREQFKTSFDYYSSRPDLLRPILDSLAKKKFESPHAKAGRTVAKDSLTKPFLPRRSGHAVRKDSLVKSFLPRPQKR